MSVLEVRNLEVTYNGAQEHEIVKNISFSVEEGECLCILGESGSGKSMTLKAVMGLLDKKFSISGSADFNNLDLLNLSEEQIREIRGKDIAMVLQNPMGCFDSLYNIEYQIVETLREHTDFSKKEIRNQAVDILKKMKIVNPEEVLKKYPHELSGGMLQRIMIGTALMLKPKILIADEPTSSIDAITQFEIIKEFKRLKEQNITMIFITHDLGVASMLADRIIVLNKGKIVDQGTFEDIINSSSDPYTKLLIEKKLALTKKYKMVMGVHND